MKKEREALINHIDNSSVAFEVIKKHEGEADEPRNITAKCPGCYVMFVSGNPGDDDGRCEFDCLIITESKSFLATEDDALQLADELADYLRENLSFDYDGNTFWIDTNFPTDNIWPGKKHTILALTVTIYQGS
jgi:hypothetical protein